MRSSSWWLGAAALIVLAPFACSSSFSSDTTGSGGAGAGTSSSSGTVTDFTCDAPEDCPPATSQCETIDCFQHQCVKHPLAAGMSVPNPIAGNCIAELCDGAGNQTTKPDDSDVYDDGNPCTLDRCVDNKPSNAPQEGAACTDPDNAKAQVCDDQGACVECVDQSQCKGVSICAQGRCVAASCIDKARDGSESDVDCGGDCPPCNVGDACNSGGDCVSGVCSGTCQSASCTDHTKNGQETDKDCGGPTCPPCADGEDCADPADCESGVCDAGSCAVPTCTDGVLNGKETDQDCGGSCPGCVDGADCKVDGDCLTGHCDPNLKCNHCDDGKVDFGETDTDCGSSCAMIGGDLCANGKKCRLDDDCTSNLCCIAQQASSGTCSDHCSSGSSGSGG